MKSSLYVIAALFATASAITTMPEQNDFIDLQVGVEATARANVREMLKANLRAYLERPSGVTRSDLDMWILPGSVPVMHQPSSDPLVFEAVQLDAMRGDAWPGPILPGSEPILPISSSNPEVFEESFVQIKDDDMPTVEDARAQAAQMQASMDQAIAEADAKRAEQQQQYEKNINNDDPAGQLQGLMNAQASLHRLTSAFSAKPNLDKVSGMAQKLGIPMTPELMQLGTNEAISNALVEIAVGMGKTESEISNALAE
jgi:hypothetical protein